MACIKLLTFPHVLDQIHYALCIQIIAVYGFQWSEYTIVGPKPNTLHWLLMIFKVRRLDYYVYGLVDGQVLARQHEV